MKTILFYGNCHSSVIAKWLHDNYSDRFRVVDCRECDVPEFHTTKVFATWAHSEEQQRNYLSRLHKKIEEVDYFVFQHVNNSMIDELKTDFLVNNVASGKSICIPNPRFFAYPLCTRSFIPFIKYAYNNISSDKYKILDYLICVDDPELNKIILEMYDFSMKENIKRCAESSLVYKNNIDMCSFISENWRQHLLFGTHNHPAGIYWDELAKKLFEQLDESYIGNKISLLQYPNLTHVLDVTHMLFFRNAFPNIAIHQKPKHRLRLKKNIDLIFDESLIESYSQTN